MLTPPGVLGVIGVMEKDSNMLELVWLLGILLFVLSLCWLLIFFWRNWLHRFCKEPASFPYIRWVACFYLLMIPVLQLLGLSIVEAIPVGESWVLLCFAFAHLVIPGLAVAPLFMVIYTYGKKPAKKGRKR